MLKNMTSFCPQMILVKKKIEINTWDTRGKFLFQRKEK